MYIQQRYLKESDQFASTSGLDTIDLPNSGLLLGIELRVWGTAGSGGDKPDVWLHDRMTKLEIVCNGSQVIKSLSGDQLLALMLYQKTNHHSHDMKNMSAASCEEFFHINLGRHFHDLEYFLDLSRVNDPELRIEYDFTKTSQNGWTNGVAMSAAPNFSVICHLLRDSNIVPKGYIKTAEVTRFTSADSKKENMHVPRGPVYSNLYLQSWYKAQGIGYLLDKLEVNINNGELIPLRVGPTELACEVVRQYGLFRMMQQMSVKGGQAYPYPLEQAVVQNIQVGLVDAEAQMVDVWGNAATVGFRETSDGVTPVTSNINVNLSLLGTWPFSVSPIPIFDSWDERTWVDSSKLGDLWVRVEENSSGGTSAVLKLLADEVVTRY